jgi:hypothetical protein
MTSQPESAKLFVEPDSFSGIDIPPELEESLRRHRENLVRLVTTLRSAGISQAQIEESVAVIVASYKYELMQALNAWMR